MPWTYCMYTDLVSTPPIFIILVLLHKRTPKTLMCHQSPQKSPQNTHSEIERGAKCPRWPCEIPCLSSLKYDTSILNTGHLVEVCIPECQFPGTGYFPKKIGKFPVPSIWKHPIPGPGSLPAFGTGQLPSRLSPENEMGIPKFEISGISIPFKTFPEWYQVVPSCPKFFPNFSRIFPSNGITIK